MASIVPRIRSMSEFRIVVISLLLVFQQAFQPVVHLTKRAAFQNPSKKIQIKQSGNESGCLLGGKGGCHVPVSRRDIMRIARRFNAGKHPAWRTSPEGTAEGSG